MSDNQSFFTESNNAKTIKTAYTFLNKFSFENNDIEQLKLKLTTVLDYIIRDGEFFDKNCQLSIGWIGNSLINTLENINLSHVKKAVEAPSDQGIDSSIKDAFEMIYRFLCEADFNSPNGLNHNLTAIIETIDDNIHTLNDSAKRNITSSRLLLPAYILKQLIHHEKIDNIVEFNRKISTQEENEKAWLTEIDSREKIVNQLKNKLEEYKKGFNFVGLHKGFDDLSLQKNKEQTWALGFVVALGFLTLSPVGIEIFLFLFKTAEIQKYSNVLVYAIFPTITIQLVLIYFFRVALMNYKSIKAQLLQLELRKTLCSFIQSYTSYAKEMKSNDNASLEKFENLIFSGIISNEEQLPSTFDGIEQFGRIMQTLKPLN